MDGLNRRTSRRALLGAAAALAGGAALAACSSKTAAGAAGSSAQPSRTNPRTTVVFYAKPPNATTSQATLISIMQEVLTPYYALHPGIDVKLIPEELADQTIITGILAGQQMDIIYSNYFAPYYQQQLILPLQEYFKQDAVDPTIWNAAQYALYNTAQGPMAIPVYTGTTAYAVNQALFDNLGLQYPDASWTQDDFVNVSRSATQAGKALAYGSDIFWYSNGPSQQASWVFKAFGGNQVSTSGAPSQLGSTQNQAALTWLYEDLFWPKISAAQDIVGTTQFIQGRLGLLMMATWELLDFAEALKGPALKFDFVPNPVFPAGRTTFCTADFYAIAANTQHADDCWDLLNWVSVQPQWQRATFSYALRSPALNSLWDEWATTIQTVVPFFRGKDFSWFGDAASKGYAYPVEYYPQADQSVWNLISPYFTQLYQQKIPTVQQAAAQIDQVVNAYETAAQSEQAQAQSEAQHFPTNGAAMTTVPTGL